jgi:putative sigma-54 modulation protein
MEVPMNIKMHSIRFDADQKLINFIDTKVKKLPTVYDDILGAEVFLRLNKDADRENKLVEIKLDVKGSTVFAKKQCKTFEEATDLSIDALKKQLVKRKAKIRKK